MLIKLSKAIDIHFDNFEQPPERKTALRILQAEYHTEQIGSRWYVDLERPLSTIRNDVDLLIKQTLGMR